VDHSHIKLGTVAVQGKAPEYIRVIEEARNRGVDFLADCYPYDRLALNLKVTVPDKQYENPKSVAKAIADLGGPDHLTVTEFKPNNSYAGHSLAEIANPTNFLQQICSFESSAKATPPTLKPKSSATP